jgi:RNA polymerase sigma-70 factor, ECF subfamily
MGAAETERFGEWMRAHLGMLHRISRAFAAGADQHDLMQELMLAVWRAAPAFRGEAQETTFIYRVAHNAALTWRRRESAGARRRSAAHQAALEMETCAQDRHQEALLARLYAAIRALEPLDRSLVVLSLEGESYAAIGAVHGLSESNVGARLTRARRKLALLMEDADES